MKIKVYFILIAFCALSAGASYAQEEQAGIASAPGQDKISLDIKGMDIVDALKMLANRAGTNIVIGKNVSGRVTFFLKDVDIKDAFDIVVLANELAYDEKGGILNIMTQREYELLYGERFEDKKQAKVITLKYAKASDLSRALNQIKTNIGRVVVDEGSNTLALIDTPQKIKEMEEFIKNTDLLVQTKIFELNYAQADKLQAKIQEAITKGVGTVHVDERTNKIAVTDYPEKLDEIAKIVGAFDEKTPQVLIDSQIIEIKPKDEFKMGVDWDFWLKKNLKLVSSMPTSGAVNNLSVGMAAKGISNSGEGDYKGIVDLLRTIGDTQILSSPRIAALNNQEAKILIGTKEVYVSQSTSQSGTGTEVTADEVNFVDVGIKLYVTPNINRDGFISMKIRPEVSSVKSTYTYGSPAKSIPIVETSEAETTVMIKDGVTIIIGGLKKDKKANTVDKIPFLGDIPLLGLLFRRTNNSYEKTELVILLTPHILSGSEPYTDLSDIQPREGAIAHMDSGEITVQKTSDSAAQKDNQKYYAAVKNKVQVSALSDRPRGKKGEVNLAFTLAEDGTLMGEAKVLQAASPALALSAANAVKLSSPFPAFPDSIKKEKETFNIKLSYE